MPRHKRRVNGGSTGVQTASALAAPTLKLARHPRPKTPHRYHRPTATHHRYHAPLPSTYSAPLPQSVSQSVSQRASSKQREYGKPSCAGSTPCQFILLQYRLVTVLKKTVGNGAESPVTVRNLPVTVRNRSNFAGF
jgi:hypothetical protein